MRLETVKYLYYYILIHEKVVELITSIRHKGTFLEKRKITIAAFFLLTLSSMALLSDSISSEQIPDGQTEHKISTNSIYSPYSIPSSASKKLVNDRSIGRRPNDDETAPISIYQRADKESILSGGTINFTITYRNNLGLQVSNAVVTDILPEIEYYTSEPAPTYVSGSTLVWTIGNLMPGEMGSIELTVDLNDSGREFVFEESQSTSGKGFVRIHRGVSTPSDQQNTTFANYVSITANCGGIMESSSDSSSIEVINGIKPELCDLASGSGTYYRDDKIEIGAKGGNCRIDDELSASYGQESFALPANRSIDFNSKWSNRFSNKDDLMDFSSAEEYRYAENINRESRFKVNNNESSFKFDVEFTGAASIDVRVGENARSNKLSGKSIVSDRPEITLKRPDTNYESKEEYLGNFSLSEKINLEGDSYQERVEAYRTASGNGSVAVDMRIESSQRSYESGTGKYQVDDIIKTRDNSIIKDINIEKLPANFTYSPNFSINLSRSWEEGLISRSASGDGSNKLAGSDLTSRSMAEEYSNIDYLRKNSEVKGLNEMKSTADFSGQAEFKVQAETSDRSGKAGQTFIMQEYSGSFNITRDIKIVGAPKYSRPHLSISKTGKADLANNTFVDYTIQITNDGDSALSHIVIQDFLPPETSFVHSSLKPRVISSAYVNWTVPVKLDIGESYIMDLRLNINERAEHLINQAYAYMDYGDTVMKSRCVSRLPLNWPEMDLLPGPAIRMAASIDDEDPMTIRYSIMLENNYDASIIASPFCTLPEEMTFLNSSISPKRNTSTDIVWDPITLSAGENKTIELRARASENGTYVSKSTLKMIGPKLPTVKVAVAAVDINEVKAGAIQEEHAQDNNPMASDWQPPSCFSLNCTREMCYEDDWCPCTGFDADELIE